MDRRLAEYYSATASHYDYLHSHDYEHEVAIRYISLFLAGLTVHTLADIGTGTGRVLRALEPLYPQMQFFAVDGSLAMIASAANELRSDRCSFVVGDVNRLPFRSKSIDVLTATGLLHHVEYPDAAIMEMSRISRQALFLSDTNMYGRGPIAFRLVKLIGSRIGLGTHLQRLRHGGSTWIESDGDGHSKAYSLFDSLPLLEREFDQVFLIPTRGSGTMQRVPLLFASHLFVAAIRY